MTVQSNVAKLIYISSEQKERLMEIKNMVTEIGGKTSLNELIRDAIDVAIYFHKNEIVEQHKPRSIIDKWSW